MCFAFVLSLKLRCIENMADPLSLLRDFHIKGKPIKAKDDLIIFGDIAFKKDSKTNFVKYGFANYFIAL